jgi:hypothetical protein
MTSRFCGDCGRSLVPLTTPHVERPCGQCGKSTFIADPGPDGVGIRVEKGDKFTIPAGWLKISLDPAKASGQLTRPGVTWFAGQLLVGGVPTQDEQVEEYLERLRTEADKALEASPLLSHLDPDDAASADAAIEILKDKQETVEWWLLLMGSAAAWLLDELHSGADPAVIRTSARMQATHSMVGFSQSLEPHVWAGYQHTSLIYGIASAASRDPADAEKIKALRPVFERQSEEVLHAWVASGVDIAPRLGVRDLEEPLLKALAQFHLSAFERQRTEKRLDQEHRARAWSNRIAGAVAGAAVAGTLVTIITALF